MCRLLDAALEADGFRDWVLLTVSLDAKAEPDDDEVEFSHVRTADERNAEGFANAEFVG